MVIKYHKEFRKNYRKRVSPNPKLVSKFQTTLKQFIDNPKNPTLKEHKLVGRLGNYRAFSMTGNIRIVYRIVGDELWLYNIGTHAQVY